MVSSVARQRLKVPGTLVLAVATGVATAMLVHAIPLGTLESIVTDSGLPAIVPAAEPPLGMTARMLIEGSSGLAAGLLSWLLGLAVLGVDRAVRRPRHVVAGSDDDMDVVPSVRRADAHPDAPPRPPLRANRDLGTPFLDIHAPRAREVHEPAPPVELPSEPALLPGQPDAAASWDAPSDGHAEEEPAAAEQPLPLPPTPPACSPPPEQELPADWDRPLAAYDPAAIPPEPLEPPVQPTRISKELRPQVFNPYERIETFELNPPPPAVVLPPRPTRPAPIPANETEEAEATVSRTEATIQALIDRLERGLERKSRGDGHAPEPAVAPVQRNSGPGFVEAVRAEPVAPEPERPTLPPELAPPEQAAEDEGGVPRSGLEDTLAYLRNLAARS